MKAWFFEKKGGIVEEVQEMRERDATVKKKVEY